MHHSCFQIAPMRLLLVLILVLFSVEAYSQVKVEAPNVVTAREPSKAIDRLVFEFNSTHWLNTPTMPDTVSTKWYNRGINAYITWDLKLGESKRFTFSPGIGLSNHNIYMDSWLGVDTDSTSNTFGQTALYNIPDSINYSKYKLGTTHLELPLELRWRSKPNKFHHSWKVGVGLRVGYLLQGMTKYKGVEEDALGLAINVKRKELNLRNVASWRFGPSLRLGYGNFNLVAYYSINTLFNKNQGPGVNAFSIGFSFNSL